MCSSLFVLLETDKPSTFHNKHTHTHTRPDNSSYLVKTNHINTQNNGYNSLRHHLDRNANRPNRLFHRNGSSSCFRYFSFYFVSYTLDRQTKEDDNNNNNSMVVVAVNNDDKD